MDKKENPRSGRGRGTAVAALLTRLSAEFPVIREFRPLVLKLDLASCDAARGTTDKQQRRALALHCASPRNLENVAAGGPRYALDGTVCGEVSRLQREAAKARLETIANAALRKATRLAKRRRRE
jgi:sRNA-binding protein